MTHDELKEKLGKPYDQKDWLNLIRKIFKEDAIELLESPKLLESSEGSGIESCCQLGTIKLENGKLPLIEAKVLGNTDLRRNRVGLRNYLIKLIKDRDIDGILATFSSENHPNDYRLSFATIKHDYDEKRGELTDSQTDPKRFTYVLGANQSCATAAHRFKKLVEKNQEGLKLEDIFEAFSVEKLNDEFFAEYKEHYQKFHDYLLKDSQIKKKTYQAFRIEETKDKNEKPVRDFVKLLLGRIVFLHFLQKKGWMGCPQTGEKWEEGDQNFIQRYFKDAKDKDKFHSKHLLPLFYEALNKERKGDIFAPTETRIPYLNGGLFEESEAEEGAIDFPAEYFEKLLEFFSHYNFTIDENDPNDHEVGIDPEMLGHIFESLLEDNKKEKGAYYTPKAIVQYMCQQSIIAYLLEHLGETKESRSAIEFLVHEKQCGENIDHEKFIEKHAEKIDQYLNAIKICDPAVGSGAFPIGLLQEIFGLKLTLGLTLNEPLKPAEIKRNIIQNSIYGVDIDSGAVDIARLRFWLALIVDEEEPSPLPNLDYKIMQGNSLLESFEGIDLTYGAQGEGRPKQGDYFQESKDVAEKIQELIDQYFSKTNPEKKQELHSKIDKCVLQHIKDAPELRAKTKANEEKMKRLKALEKGAERPYFLWHLFFQDVFKKGGFDIIIGNPPYRQVKRGTYPKSQFPYAEGEDKGKQNLYKLFVELSYNLCRQRGVATMIVSGSLMGDESSSATRKLLLDKTDLKCIIEFPEKAKDKAKQVFKSVAQGTCIYLFRKQKTHNPAIAISIGNDSHSIGALQFTKISKKEIEALYPQLLCLPKITAGDVPILRKIARNSTIKPLSELARRIQQGDINLTSCKKDFSHQVTGTKLLRGKHIERYRMKYDEADEYILDKLHTDKIEHNQTNTFLVSQEIHASTAARRLHFALHQTQQPIIWGHSTNKTVLVNQSQSKYFLALLNAKLMDWFFRLTSSNNHVQGYELKLLPIPEIPKAEQQPFMDLVDKILAAKKSGTDTMKLEAEIDKLVYQLYGLSEDEIAMVKSSSSS